MLNYQHLRYFWVVAREGSLTRASRLLRLAPSTLSAQIKALEAQLGHALFERKGRGLVLTERGEVARRYADDIFSLGEELVDAVGRATGLRHAYRFRVGVGSDLSKLMAWELLSPALHLEDFPVHLVVWQDRPDRLVADLAVHRLDLVLTDRPVGLASDVQVESVQLGRSAISLMAAPSLASHVLKDFPESLHGAPVLLPRVGSTMRQLLEEWFAREGLHPRVVGEFGDSTLLKAFGQEGAGVFPVPAVVRPVVEEQYRVVEVGRLDGVWESIYGIVVPARRGNPAVRAVLDGDDKTIRLERIEHDELSNGKND